MMSTDATTLPATDPASEDPTSTDTSTQREDWLDDDTYDVILLGTGAAQSILAAALSRAGKTVLHLDQEEFYGGVNASETLKNFVSRVQQRTKRNEIDATSQASDEVTKPFSVIRKGRLPLYSGLFFSNSQDCDKNTSNNTKSNSTDDDGSIVNTEEPTPSPTSDATPYTLEGPLVERDRDYNLDAAPKLLWARGGMVELLIRSGVSSYLEFKTLEASFLFRDQSIQLVPCSRAEVFRSKSISLIEKRYLMKFMKPLIDSITAESAAATTPGADSAAGVEGDVPEVVVEEEEEEEEISFEEHLKSNKLSDKLRDYIMFALARAGHSPAALSMTKSEGLSRLRQYVGSVGRFGDTPFLVSLYGCSEISQAFSRLCAVKGGVYILRRGIESLTIDEDTKTCTGVVCDAGQALKCSWLVGGIDHLNFSGHAVRTTPLMSHCMCITDRSIVGSAETVLVTIPPNSTPLNNPSAIHILQFSQRVCATPKGRTVLYVMTPSSGNDDGGDDNGSSAKKDLESAVEQVLRSAGSATDGSAAAPKLLWSCYFTRLHREQETADLPHNVVTLDDACTENIFGFEKEIAQARSTFERICPDKEFFEPKKEEEEKGEEEEKEEKEEEETKEETPKVAEEEGNDAKVKGDDTGGVAETEAEATGETETEDTTDT